MSSEGRNELVPSPWTLLWVRFRRNRVAMAGAVILAVLYLSSCLAGFLSPYDFDDTETRGALAGPALFGGHRAEVVARHTFLDEDDREVVLPEYRATWRFFRGGVHFRDPKGRLTWRPHVHPLLELESWDEHAERGFVLVADETISLPIRFFVEGRKEHEVASLCGLLPVQGRLHLMGVDAGDAGDRLSPSHVVRLYLLGSDRSGRDFFTRILYGGQISLSVGLLGIALTMGMALLVGGISGYFGGVIDFVAMRVVEVLMAIPGLYLILTLRAAFPKDLSSRESYLLIVAVLALAGWASLGRVIRGMVLSIREEDYALAARALGASNARVILRHVLPNTASFVIVTATLYVPYYILGEASLSFLGLGITEPETSWGLLLRDAQNTEILKYHPWLVLPGAFIFVAVLAFNFLGDGLRDAADPKAAHGH